MAKKRASKSKPESKPESKPVKPGRSTGPSTQTSIDSTEALCADNVTQALRLKSRPDKAEFFPRFFRTGPGEYGEGDQFLGVVVPDQRKITKQFNRLPRTEVAQLLESPFHECRLTGLLILVDQFERSTTDQERKSIYDFYLKSVDRINNWDLVDSSCHKILGPYLFKRSRRPLFQLARADHLWKNRIAMVTTYYFICRNDFDTTLEIAESLLDHPHDLIHKAVGWMLREMGKRDEPLLLAFLRKHATVMPRTMLRYSIEKFPKTRRDQILKGKLT